MAEQAEPQPPVQPSEQQQEEEAEAGKKDEGQKPKEGHPFVVYSLAICATIGGLLFGYDTGIINGAILLIKKEYSLSTRTTEFIVSSTVGGAALFSIMAGVVADKIGRKPTIMISAVVFTIGGFLMGFATGPAMILLGRIVVGASIGFVSAIVPVYVSECSPPDIRGRLVTMNQLFITIGILVSAILAGGFQSLEHGWRYMLGLAAVPGIIQFICFLGLPESPRYQVMKNQMASAEATLKLIRKKNDVSEELGDIQKAVVRDKDSTGLMVWVKIFSTPHVRKALFIGCMLQFFQQFCGINTVIYYGSVILFSAGFDVHMAIWLSVIPFSINFLATFIGLWAVESLGRKLVLAISFVAIALALLVLTAGFYLSEANSPPTLKSNEVVADAVCSSHPTCSECISQEDCGFCFIEEGKDDLKGSCLEMDGDKGKYSATGRCALDNDTETFFQGDQMMYSTGFCPNDYAYLAVAGLVLFVLGFAPGAGPMPWTINAEIYPLWARSVAMSMATFTNWACNFIVSNTFLTMLKTITAKGTFLVFAAICLLGAAFVMIMVPETKDKTLEEVELLFMKPGARNAKGPEKIEPENAEAAEEGTPGATESEASAKPT